MGEGGVFGTEFGLAGQGFLGSAGRSIDGVFVDESENRRQCAVKAQDLAGAGARFAAANLLYLAERDFPNGDPCGFSERARQILASQGVTWQQVFVENGLGELIGGSMFFGDTSPITSFALPTGGNVPQIDSGSGGGGILSTILDGAGVLGSVLQSVLPVVTGLAQAGVIRGSVGMALAPQQTGPTMAPGGLTAMDFNTPALQQALAQSLVASGQLQLPSTAFSSLQNSLIGTIARTVGVGTGLAVGDDVLNGAMSAISSLFGGGMAACGTSVRLNMSNAAALFSAGGCSGRPRLKSRYYVDNPDGSVSVLANMGKARFGSNEVRVAKSIARRNGLTVARRGAARSRRRPR